MAYRFPWIRFHVDVIDDDVLTSVLTGDQYRVWTFLEVLAGANADRRGTVPGDVAWVAWRTRSPRDLVADTVAILVKHHRVRLVPFAALGEEANVIEVLGFLERQYDKPSDYPEAVKARKDKRKPKGSRTDRGTSAENRDDGSLQRRGRSRGEEEERRGEVQHAPTPSSPAASPPVPDPLVLRPDDPPKKRDPWHQPIVGRYFELFEEANGQKPTFGPKEAGQVAQVLTRARSAGLAFAEIERRLERLFYEPPKWLAKGGGSFTLGTFAANFDALAGEAAAAAEGDRKTTADGSAVLSAREILDLANGPPMPDGVIVTGRAVREEGSS